MWLILRHVFGRGRVATKAPPSRLLQTTILREQYKSLFTGFFPSFISNPVLILSPFVSSRLEGKLKKGFQVSGRNQVPHHGK